jgi:hypothetical protein
VAVGFMAGAMLSGAFLVKDEVFEGGALVLLCGVGGALVGFASGILLAWKLAARYVPGVTLCLTLAVALLAGLMHLGVGRW